MLPDVVSYLVAQLKVNFRPLYAETISALAGLAGQHGEIVWSAIWQEMEALSTAKSVSVIDLGVENPEWVSRGAKHTTGYSSGDEDEEADFGCHNLEKSRLAVNGAWDVFRNAGELDANEVSVSLCLLTGPSSLMALSGSIIP